MLDATTVGRVRVCAGQLPVLLLLNVAIFTGALAAGAYAGRLAREQGTPIRAPRAVRAEQAVFEHVVVSNAKVMALVMIGVGTLGLVSALVITWNGFQLGAGLEAVFSTQPEVGWLLMRYVPIEFCALILLSAASMRVSWQIVEVLFAGRAGAFGMPFIAFVGAGALLVIAALIEADVAVRIASLG